MPRNPQAASCQSRCYAAQDLRGEPPIEQDFRTGPMQEDLGDRLTTSVASILGVAHQRGTGGLNAREHPVVRGGAR